MKNLILMASITAAILLVNTANAATNGTVNFSGKLTDQTCQVTLNDGASASGTVILPTVPKEKLTTSFNTAGKTTFKLKLTGCKASSTPFGVLAYFPPTTYTESVGPYGYLKNLETGTTAAQGVYLKIVQLFGTNEKEIYLGKSIPNGNYQYTTVAAGATSADLNYYTQYVSWGSTSITAGKVKGMAVYELYYE
ncbi:fimbrial protein [Phytobacter diazotrophicus]|uniref:fimbrial protein n=1 Tax=Phytobacter diazotrophicus TaxID=395631 RepID=UPI00232CCF64|nr:fimbrial protein [Phytobacter diazotrophicus]MDC0726462.1 fimbrial protein [Phytobacter diazotrophicus]MDC0733691.1 fimbrial protein [Phytobacter diazotrophicus]